MFSFVALYSAPGAGEEATDGFDAAAFAAYYRDTHAGICRRWPGLRSATVTHVTGTPRGTPAPYVLKGEFHFDSREAFMAAMQSESGEESRRDARRMGEQFGVLATMFVGETDTLPTS